MEFPRKEEMERSKNSLLEKLQN